MIIKKLKERITRDKKMQEDGYVTRVKKVRDKLNKVGKGFCAMKWLHQTLYLHTGDNHSCYHPRPHHIGIDEIAKNPAALHNTEWKKRQRKTMLDGGRPDECYYCWNIEDLEGEHLSDRMFHSASDFAEPEIEKLSKLPWDADINPKYLEISFGNGCNFRCAYCSPQASTRWMEEIRKNGNYDLTYNQYGIDFLENGTYYGPKEENPYIDAFWKWWPSLRKDLHTLRITGGEPLMNPGTMQFFDLLEDEPAPQLFLSVNSNLGASTAKIEKMYDRIDSLLSQKKVRDFSLFTSIEGWGEQAEYMRTGLECNHWERNFKSALDRGWTINIMCTFNILCVGTFKHFLEKVVEWRKEYGNLVRFDTPYLKEPPHWKITILTDDFLVDMDENLQFIKDRPDVFTSAEFEKMKRVRDYMYFELRKASIASSGVLAGRRDFYSFFTENDKRLGTDMIKLFPRYKEFYKLCKVVYECYDK
jgi:organic radical activating enzyme